MVKVGDKVRLTTDGYSKERPRGAICTVVRDHGNSCMGVTIDCGDGRHWFLKPGEFEPITPEKPEFNYAEQAAKHGIKITVMEPDGQTSIFDGTK